MIFDAILTLLVLGALFNGYKNGLFTTLLRTAFFIAGGIAGMYLVVHFNKSGWLIAAIIGGAYGAAFLGTMIAKALKITIIRGPLRWIDNVSGAIFEAAKYLLLFYVIGTILLWAPWVPGQNAVSQSKLFNKIDTYAPSVVTGLRGQVEKLLESAN
jgi:uncharacterized membrane protein required for colicin V production